MGSLFMMVFGFDVVGCVQSCLNNKYTNQVQLHLVQTKQKSKKNENVNKTI